MKNSEEKKEQNLASVFFTGMSAIILVITMSPVTPVTASKDNIWHCSNLEELSGLVNLSIKAIFLPDILEDSKQVKYKEEIFQVIKYIDRNYNRKISLALFRGLR